MQWTYRIKPRDLGQFLTDLIGTGLIVTEKRFDGEVWIVTVATPDATGNPVVEDAAVSSVVPTDEKLGSLSAQYESGSRSTAAIGNDLVGGFSYGKYQIATRTGTFGHFMTFLSLEYPNLHQSLQDAGGVTGAKNGTSAFRNAWSTLAATAPLQEAEHAYIKASHYDRFVSRLDGIGLHVSRRSSALKNVIWSVAVQHGPGNSVVANALAPLADPEELKDKAIIEAIYKERSNVSKYFSGSTSAVKKAVKKRFKAEKKDALAMLASK